MLAVCSIQEEKSMEVMAERRDIYTRVPVICSFNLCDMIIVIHILRFIG